MARSRQVFSTASFARCGASVALAATLAVGSVPAISLAQASLDMEGTPIALAAEAGYDLNGQSYVANVTWAGSSDLGGMASVAQGMLTNFFGNQVQVSQNEDGSFNVVISFVEYNDAIQQIEYNGQSIQQSSDQTYTLVVSSLDEPIAAKLYIGGAMAGMFPNGVGFTMTIDASGLPAAEPEPAPEPEPEPEPTPDPDQPGESGLVAGTLYAVPLDLGASTAGSMLGKNAYVMPNADGTYDVTITVAASSAYCFSGLTVGGVPASKAYSADGASYVFTAEGVSSLDGAITLGFTYTPYGMWLTKNHSADATFNVDAAAGEAQLPAVKDGAVKFDLDNTIAAAKKIEQGAKSDAAWSALQEAIATAEAASASPMIPQVGVDGSTGALIEAIQTFNASKDVSDPAPDEDPQPSGETYGMEVGATYTAQVAYAGTGAYEQMGEMLQTMVGRYFGNQVYVELLEDGTFDVTVYFGGTTGYDDAVGDLSYNGQAIKQSAERTYTFNTASLSEPIELGLHVGGTMNMDITYAMTVDTSTLKAQGESPAPVVVDKSALESLIDEAAGIQQGGKTDAAYADLQAAIGEARTVAKDPAATQAQVNNAVDALQRAIDNFNASQEVKFQRGHTYQVPIDFLKHNSSEVSMADQYFGDTALVRVSEDGTMLDVSFAATAEGMTHIISLAYQGATLSPSGTQFTVRIPYTENNVVLPISMTIKEMQELGGPAQTADLHLYLTQAKDLGTNAGGLTASSARTLADTGDDASSAAAVAGAAAVAAAAAAASVAGSRVRRRLTHKE